VYAGTPGEVEEVPGEEWDDGSPLNRMIISARTLPGSLMVNMDGERFCNESNNYNDLGKSFSEFDAHEYDHRNVPAWAIFDQSYRDSYAVLSVRPDDDTPDWMSQADTIVDLAEQTGIDEDGLRETLEQFNEHARDGVDPEFHRGESPHDKHAGDPDAEASQRYVEALAAGGADVIELGLPFSEPIAEGPTIQSAIVRSLEGGMTPRRYFEFVEELDSPVPVVCMTYYNLIYQYGDSGARRASDSAGGEAASEKGPAPFVRRAAEVGIDGFVVPDLPAEEAGPLREACDEHGLDLISIVAPTTTESRLEKLLGICSGYVYVQARLGTTGAREDVSDRTEESLARLEGYDVPKAVGFGIKEGEHAARIVEAGADGVIVGSAIVDLIAEGVANDDPTETVADRIREKARELKRGALRGADADTAGVERP